jgi:hypothetical protein
MSTTQIDDLAKLVERELNLGQRDPHKIYARLKRQLGEETLRELSFPYLPDLVADMARQRMNQLRRTAIAKISEKTLQDPEVMLKSLWVPSDDEQGIVYKRIADMTAEDFRARAAYLDRMVVGIAVHAAWCREVADQIEIQGVTFAKELERLPSLPELV